VVLENGDAVQCDDVVINADFGHAMSTLFPAQKLGKYSSASLKKIKYSCSTFMIYLGLDRTYPEVEHHVIVFAQDYKARIEEIARGKTMSEDMSLYIRNASPLDPSCAPPGHSALYILAPVPNNTSGIDWEKQKAAYRESILNLMEERTPYKDVRSHIREEMIITPADWENKMMVFLGATFNIAHSWDQMLYFRPHNQFELFENTYLVGGGTHPGSGLPTIFESARISSGLISKKYGVPYPEPRPFVEEVIA
jgi:phytoene desaturase